MMFMFTIRTLRPFVILLLCLHGALSSRICACSETQTCAQGWCLSSNRIEIGLSYHEETCPSNDIGKPEWGEHAKIPNAKCPLNVCCSKDGFCGTTEAFCGIGCQSNCASPTQPSCKNSFWTAKQRRVGYYQSSSYTRKPYPFLPFLIDARKWTHLNYAFASIDALTFEIAQMNAFDTKLYTEFTSLKERNPSLRVYISVGGWDAGGAVFSAMVSTAANRAAFIQSAMKFMRTYAFDGIDIDWKYPISQDRGGSQADYGNFVSLVQELRAATGTKFGITVVLPASYQYLKGFDVQKIEPYVDWFNLATYDLHGTWDGMDKQTSAIVQAHSNITEIDNALSLLWRNKVKSSKVVLGLSFYGRSFTLKDPSCNKPGCPSLGAGKPGEYTGTAGILSWDEVRDLIQAKGLKPVLDQCAWVKYATWDNDQWVSFEDAETFALKMIYANVKFLGGTVVWAVDLDALGDGSGINALLSDNGKTSADMRATLNHDNGASLGVFWTPCLPPSVWAGGDSCPPGYRATYLGYGKVFDADLSHLEGQGCRGSGRQGFMRVLCVEDTLKLECQWGPGARSKACNSLCPEGWITLTKNSHIGGQDVGCKSGRYAPLCCQSVKGFRSDGDVCYGDVRNQHLAGGLGQRRTIGTSRAYRWVSRDGGSVAVKSHDEMRSRQDRDEDELGLHREHGVDLVGACPGALPRDYLGLDIPAVLHKTVT